MYDWITSHIIVYEWLCINDTSLWLVSLMHSHSYTIMCDMIQSYRTRLMFDAWVVSYIIESQHKYATYATYVWVMSYVTAWVMHESCPIVLSHVQSCPVSLNRITNMRHMRHMHESCPISLHESCMNPVLYYWVTSQRTVSEWPCIRDTNHVLFAAYARVMSHMRKSFPIWVSHVLCDGVTSQLLCRNGHVGDPHPPHMNESCAIWWSHVTTTV